MKKVTIFVLLTAFILNCVVCANADFSQRSFPEAYKAQCITNLIEFGVIDDIREKWDENSTISRREIFEILLRIKSENGGVEYSPEDVYTSNDVENALNEKMNHFYVEPEEKSPINADVARQKAKAEACKWYVGHETWCEFADVSEESSDFAFTCALYFSSLLRGRERNGNFYADLNETATYEDAINSICRLFTYINYRNPEYAIEELINKKYGFDGHTLYHYAEEINLINTNNYADPCCPQITLNMLSQPITAYEFLVLLNRAMYIPAPNCDDYIAVEMFYYINRYTWK